MQEELYNLSVVSEDHHQYAPNIHKKVLDLNDTAYVPPPASRANGPPRNLCGHLTVKTRLAVILIFDIFFSLTHLYIWYLLDNYEFFRPLAVGGEGDISSDDHETTEINDYGANGGIGPVGPEGGFQESTVEKWRFRSKFAHLLQSKSAYIETKCGFDYYKSYLVLDKEDETRALCEKMFLYAKLIEIFYLTFDLFILFLMGLCEKNTGGKILLIVFWLLQIPPYLMYVIFLLLFNNKRFCIIQYGFAIRPQTAGTIYILIIFVFYKLLVLFRASNAYTLSLVKNKLFITLNESENDFMDRPGAEYMKYFSEKEALGVSQKLTVEKGTFRLIVEETPFPNPDPPPGSVLPSISTTTATTNASNSTRGVPEMFQNLLQKR